LSYTLAITGDIYRSMDNGFLTALVSLDISVAYDTIDHSVLSSRLQSDFSIDGKALAWIQSYLSDRHSFVQVGRSAACQQPYTAGVPQGSSGRCSSRPTSRRSVALSADLVSIITHTLMICSCTLKWLIGALWTSSRAASAVSSTGSCATTCKSEAIITGTARRHARSLQLTDECRRKLCRSQR